MNGDAFELHIDGKKAGLMVFTRSGSEMNIIHTEVDPAYGGQGYGKKLVEAAVEYATRNNLSLKADCSYARKVLAAH